MGQVQRLDTSTYLKVTLGEKAFFIKKSVVTDNPGFEEFKNSAKAAEVMGGVENLSVVDAQLGYQDSNQSWFVSKWEDLERVGYFPSDAWIGGIPNDYGKFLFSGLEEITNKSKEIYEVKPKISATIQQIKMRLREVGIEMVDIDPNLFYNPETGKFFLLDITATKTKGIRQPTTAQYKDSDF